MSRWRGDNRIAAAMFSTRSLASAPLTPVSLVTVRRRIRRTLHIRLRAGIWILEHHLHGPHRLSSAVAGGGLHGCAVEGDLAPLVEGVDTDQGLGQSALTRARFADEAQGLTLGESEVDAYEGGDVLARLSERLGYAAELDDGFVADSALDGAGRWLGEVGDLVAVVASSEVPSTHIHHRRGFAAAEVVGQRHLST